MTKRLLYQFPISHYCEKTRWNLDHKGLEYSVRNLVPGLHMRRSKRLAGVTSVPILCDGARRVPDSTGIALYLEQTYPQHSLLPADAATQQRVLALEDEADRRGAYVRHWIYGQLIGTPNFGNLMFDSYDIPQRWLGYRLAPLLGLLLRQVYRINPRTLEESLRQVQEGLDRLEQALEHNPQRYLVGDSFTLADLATAALYAPLLGPEGSPWVGTELPLEMLAMRQQLSRRVAGQWIRRMYQLHRQAHSAS